jgi:hypothetical protein
MDAELKTESVQSARLTVSHPQEGTDMGRGLALSLDGKDLPHLKVGRTFTTEIAAGHHRLRVNNTYHKKTVEFDVQSGEQVHYRIRNRVGFFGSMMISVLGAGPMYLEIERAAPAE